MVDNQRNGRGSGGAGWRDQPAEVTATPNSSVEETLPPAGAQQIPTSTPVVLPTSYAARSPALASAPRDLVRWGPVVAGFLSALTALLMLSLLGAAIGLTVLGGRVGTATTSGTVTWGAIAAIIAFLIGGFVAGRTAATVGRGAGAFNGAMVFLLAMPIILWLAGQGLGALLGSFGGVTGSLGVGFGRSAVQVAANGVRVTAWGALIAIAVGLVASAIGGALGGHGRADMPLTRHAN